MALAKRRGETINVQPKRFNMKKIILAVCLAFGGATLVNAQQQQTDRTQHQTPQGQTQSQDQTQSMNQDQQDQGEQITASELPDGVIDKLASQDYTGWTVGNIYKKKGEDQKEMFVVEMRQGTETKKVKFDQDGNKLDKHKAKDKYKHSDKKSESNQYRKESSDASSSDDATQGTTEQGTVDQAENTETQDQRSGVPDQN